MDKVTGTMAKLIERMVRAKIKLEGLHMPHRSMCEAGDDTGAPCGCRCGADEYNSRVTSAISDLRIED